MKPTAGSTRSSPGLSANTIARGFNCATGVSVIDARLDELEVLRRRQPQRTAASPASRATAPSTTRCPSIRRSPAAKAAAGTACRRCGRGACLPECRAGAGAGHPTARKPHGRRRRRIRTDPRVVAPAGRARLRNRRATPAGTGYRRLPRASRRRYSTSVRVAPRRAAGRRNSRAVVISRDRPACATRYFRVSGDGPRSVVRGAWCAQAAWMIGSKIGTATLPPVAPPPSVRRRPSALS